MSRTEQRKCRDLAPRLRHRVLPVLVVMLATISLVGCEKAIDAIEDLTNPNVASSRSMSLRTSPSTLPEGGGDVELEATVRVGAAFESGVPVIFHSTGGTFVDGDTAHTDAEGKARVTLRITTSVDVFASMKAAGVTVAESGRTTITVGDDIVPDGTVQFAISTKPKPAESGEPVVVEVKANNSTDGSRAAGRLVVQFGDGKQVAIDNFDHRAAVQHTYKEPSIFNIVVSLTDDEGKLSRETVPLKVIDGTSTQVAISAAAAEWYAREDLEFTVSLTDDNQRRGSGRVTIEWGDGRTAKLGDMFGTEKVAHLYRDRGSYKAVATVTTASGKTSTASFRVRVGDPISIDAKLSANQNVRVGDNVAFLLTTTRSDGRRPTGEVNVSYSDGTASKRYPVSSAGTRFEHEFSKQGSIVVAAAYTDDDGRTAKDTIVITVTPESSGGGGGGGDGGGGGSGGGGGGADAINAGSLTYLHADVSNWAVTSTTTSVSVSQGQICINHTKAGQWSASGGLEGNPWIVANVGGRWYAATYEWLRPGQICKAIGVPSDYPNTAKALGPHIKRSPLASWVPKAGETVYFFVSTFARDGRRNGNQRSNMVKVIWPY